MLSKFAAEAASASSITLYTFYNQAFAALKERFASTLRDDFQTVYIQWDAEATGASGGGGLPTWLFKTRTIIDKIKENSGKVIIFSDIDIQFFKPITPLLLPIADKQDMAFQTHPQPHYDNHLVNIGFMALRCNERVLRFWEEVLAIVEEQGTWDQQVVNDLLRAGFADVRYALLPSQIWAYGQDATWNRAMPADIALHHATFADGQVRKLRQMDLVALCRRCPWLVRLTAFWLFPAVRRFGWRVRRKLAYLRHPGALVARLKREVQKRRDRI